MTFLSKVTLKNNAGSGGALADILRRSTNSVPGEHKLIWTLFGKSGDEQRDFLFRRGDREGWLVLSERMPNDAHEIWDISTREFSPKLTIGQRLNFLLRANPMVSTRDAKGKRVKHDAIMMARYDTKDAKGKRTPLNQVIPDASFEWLNHQAQRSGFEIQRGEIYADGYVQHRFPKTAHQTVSISSLDYKGVLTVTDVDKFQKTIRMGFGGGRAYGFGLMMISRISE